MNMKIDASRIRTERLKRAWSQEQLAHVSGLGLRTVHRIENHGQCSLESIRALASVFELLPDELTVKPEPERKEIPDTGFIQILGSVFSGLRKYVAGGIAGAILTTFSFLLADVVMASQVHLDIQGSFDQEHVKSSGLAENEGDVVIQLDGLVRIVITPTIMEDKDSVMLKTKIFVWENEEYTLVAQPAVLAADRNQVKVKSSLVSGQTFEFSITPEIR